MSDKLRTLAEAEAKKRWGWVDPSLINPSPMDQMDMNMRREFTQGFIAGRTSVTREQIERAIMGRTATAGAGAVMAILRGETNDD